MNNKDFRNFLEVEVVGDGFKRGVMHGEAARDYIFPYHGTEILKHKDSPAVQKVLNQGLDYISSNFPDLIEELKGIAYGAKMDFWNIVIFNNKFIRHMVSNRSNSRDAGEYAIFVLIL